MFIICTRYGPVSTCPQEFHYVGAQTQTANAGALSAFIEAQLWWFFEFGGHGSYSVQYVFDSLLSGHLTSGDWAPRQKARVDSTLKLLAETANLCWRAQGPDHAPVFGRWIRGRSEHHPGWEFNDRADRAAKSGTLGFSMQRRLYHFTVAVDQLALLAAENEVRPIFVIDDTCENLYEAIRTISAAATSAIRAVLPRNTKPVREYMDSHCRALIARREEALRDGASIAEIDTISKELGRAAARAQKQFLLCSINE